MAQVSSSTLTDSLTTLLPHATIDREAVRHGVIIRQRTVEIPALVWTLVLGFQEGSHRSIAALHWAYERATGCTLARSSFYDRFTPQLATLLHSLAQDAIGSFTVQHGVPPRALASFRELLALDATVVRLHALLAGVYPATRTNHTKAAAKLHVVMTVQEGSPCRVQLTPERVHDQTPWKRVGRWVQGRLLLFDMGYFSYHLFDRIDRNDGFFLTRCKANANPRIVAVHRRWQGRPLPLVGRRLKDVLPQLKRQVLDVEVEVTFPRRAYRGTQSTRRRTFRLIALRNAETGAYHVYLTNLPTDQLAAEDIRDVYALRWQVELLFKALKSQGRLDQLPSRNQALVEAWIWASILATAVSRTLYRLVRDVVPTDRFIPLLRWAAIFARIAEDVLRLLLHPNAAEAKRLKRLLVREASDPNVVRRDRAMSGPWA